jgi:DNA ligase D-like protein (predicted polymerase)
MERASARRRNLHPLTNIPGGTPAPHPGFVQPCIPTVRDAAPAGDEWIHELKYDGWRIQAHLINGKPRLFTSNGADFPGTSISQALLLLAARDAILDGEVVVLDERGAADPNELQRDIDAGRTDRLVYFVFDMLYVDGVDLRSVPLIERKRLLAHVLSAIPVRRIRLAEHVEADGPEVFERACEMQIAGIVSRKRESAYREGLQDTWVEARSVKQFRPAFSDPGEPISRRVVAPSKEQLAVYWARVAHRALKYLARRPLELVRYPPGPMPVLPESVRVMRPKGFLGDTLPPVWIENLEGLLGLVEIGAIELHPWNCTVDDPDHPDVLVFDLEGIEWRAVTKTALALRNTLAEDGLKSWPNLTGTNGLQVIVSLPSPVTYDLAQRYSATIARRVIAKDPASNGRLFIHTEANFRTRTTIGPYSPRARPGFPIAAPVSWRRVEQGIRSDAFAITHPFHAS